MHALARLVLAGAALAAYPAGQQPSSTDTVDTHETMVRWVSPAAQAIWDVSNHAVSETGSLEPSLMDQQAWSRLQSAAQSLERYSRRLADAQSLRVGAHDDTLEGFATRSEIQAMIDADPDGFRRMARDLAGQARDLAVAAAARDLRMSGGLAEGLGERCRACHSRYWEKPID